jgi:hypothetical protein
LGLPIVGGAFAATAGANWSAVGPGFDDDFEVGRVVGVHDSHVRVNKALEGMNAIEERLQLHPGISVGTDSDVTKTISNRRSPRMHTPRPESDPASRKTTKSDPQILLKSHVFQPPETD